MKILAIEREVPGCNPDFFQSHLKAEAQGVWDLQQCGFVREIWFNASDHTAVITLECESVEEAKAQMQKLPLVQAGLITFDLLPLVPYDGFARLFKK